MKILSFTTLYPNSMQPRHGIFVEQRLKKLLQKKNVEIKVIAPVPWFPFKSKKFGDYAKYAQVPKTESRFGIAVYHPRYVVIPKIGMSIAPFLLAIAMFPVIKKLMNNGDDFDLIDAHYYYPDGIAAAILGKIFNKPVTITARGTDINLIPKYKLPKKMILWAANQVEASITVCEALREELISLGIEQETIYTLRNGVDLDLFKPKDRKALRQKKNINGKCLLSVGHLTERKGHHLVVEAMLELPDYTLLIAGDGEEFEALKNQVHSSQLQKQVFFLGALTHQQLVDIYNIADVLVLASSREGWANVLLESMACGTPVVATNIWGTPEVVKEAVAGILINERIPKAIAEGVKKIFSQYPDRIETRKYAEKFSWNPTVESLLVLFETVIKKC